jgi:hypothetical protein
MRRELLAVLATVALAFMFTVEAWAHPAHWERCWFQPQGHWESVPVVCGPWTRWEQRWVCDRPGYWDWRLVHEPHPEYPIIMPVPVLVPALGSFHGHHSPRHTHHR